ncbi:MAG: Methyltransferase type 11 [Acidimicrobiia bacterium]|nr:Methyltransferase type 11 [Acidimicrobiia bacterium]
MWDPPGARLLCPWCEAPSPLPVAAGLRCQRCGRLSAVQRGVWDAMGDQHRQSTLAQLANSIPPEPQLYEALWRRSAARRFSGGAVTHSGELGELVAAIDPQPGHVVVDLGCSEGLYGRTLAAYGAVVLAVDHSRPFLVRARRRASRAGVPLWPVRALAQHLPVADGSVDAVVIGGSLNEIGDELAALVEAHRVLAPQGRVFSTSLVTAASRAGQRFQRMLGGTGITFPSVAETALLFESAGLSVIDLRCDGILARVQATPRPS